ncbi:hypothetical protein BXU10_14625 [Flavobacterium sp. LM4]|nr:hypothetical protein BXU10_14625 [Flavobacterium sp. LM4]
MELDKSNGTEWLFWPAILKLKKFFRSEVRKVFKDIVSYPNEKNYTFGDYFRNAYQRNPVL